MACIRYPRFVLCFFNGGAMHSAGIADNHANRHTQSPTLIMRLHQEPTLKADVRRSQPQEQSFVRCAALGNLGSNGEFAATCSNGRCCAPQIIRSGCSVQNLSHFYLCSSRSEGHWWQIRCRFGDPNFGQYSRSTAQMWEPCATLI